VKQLIYMKERSYVPKSIQYGYDNESLAIDSYSQSQEVNIKKSGLRISQEYPFIGCSSDGITYKEDTNTLKNVIEIKCPYRILRLMNLKIVKIST